jgi:hypothetical protein
MIFRRATENNSLIPAIVGALNFYPDVLASRSKAEGRKGQRLVVPKGTADILGISANVRHEFTSMVGGSPFLVRSQKLGHGFAIETKWTHRPTCKCDSCEAQRGWRIEWEKRGGLYVLARSPQEAIDGLMGRRAA